MPAFILERHRLASDARQFGVWCFGVREDGSRWVIAYAMPRDVKEPRRWRVYKVRAEVASGLTREEAEDTLRQLGRDAIGFVEVPPSTGGAR